MQVQTDSALFISGSRVFARYLQNNSTWENKDELFSTVNGDFRAIAWNNTEIYVGMSFSKNKHDITLSSIVDFSLTTLVDLMLFNVIYVF